MRMWSCISLSQSIIMNPSTYQRYRFTDATLGHLLPAATKLWPRVQSKSTSAHPFFLFPNEIHLPMHEFTPVVFWTLFTASCILFWTTLKFGFRPYNSVSPKCKWSKIRHFLIAVCFIQIILQSTRNKWSRNQISYTDLQMPILSIVSLLAYVAFHLRKPIVLSDVILSLGTFLLLSLSLIQWDRKGLTHYCIIILLFLWSPVKTAAPYLYKKRVTTLLALSYCLVAVVLDRPWMFPLLFLLCTCLDGIEMAFGRSLMRFGRSMELRTRRLIRRANETDNIDQVAEIRGWKKMIVSFLFMFPYWRNIPPIGEWLCYVHTFYLLTNKDELDVDELDKNLVELKEHCEMYAPPKTAFFELLCEKFKEHRNHPNLKELMLKLIRTRGEEILLQKESLCLDYFSKVKFDRVHSETEQIEADNPETTTCHTDSPETTTFSTDNAENSTGDTDNPETTTCDTDSPETTTFSTDNAENSTGDTDNPETTTCDTDSPETIKGVIGSPETTTFDTYNPETTTCDINSPETITCNTDNPETTTGGTDSSESTKGYIDSPETTTGGTDSPETISWDIDAKDDGDREKETENNPVKLLNKATTDHSIIKSSLLDKSCSQVTKSDPRESISTKSEGGITSGLSDARNASHFHGNKKNAAENEQITELKDGTKNEQSDENPDSEKTENVKEQNAVNDAENDNTIDASVSWINVAKDDTMEIRENQTTDKTGGEEVTEVAKGNEEKFEDDSEDEDGFVRVEYKDLE